MTNVIVVFPKIDNAKHIRGILVKNGFGVNAVCTCASQAIVAADSLGDGIIVCGYKLPDMMYHELHQCLYPRFEMLLVASKNSIEEGISNDIISLAMPIKINDLINTLEMMVYNAERRKRRHKAMPKKRNDRDQGIIIEAKKLLIERNNMTEDEAHRYLQKCSMDNGSNMIEKSLMVMSLLKG